jgi:hypothetical protein
MAYAKCYSCEKKKTSSRMHSVQCVGRAMLVPVFLQIFGLKREEERRL